MKFIFIQGKKVNYGRKPFIIAEAGVNHNGSLDLALKLIDAAAFAGADAVKFQTFRAEQVVTAGGEMADYQKRNIGASESQLAMLKKLELPEKWYPALLKRAKQRKIIFLSTPHGGFSSVDLLEKFDVPAFKFGSADLTNTPLLAYAARYGKPMIVSTGMGTMAEISQAVRAIRKFGNDKIILLHCTTNYPCGLEEVNLRAMESLNKAFGVLVGYSDHTPGVEISVAATAMGVCLIEKHLTLDKNLSGPDHKASLNPEEFTEMVRLVRNTSLALGSSEKKPGANEKKYMSLVRKSVVSVLPIKKGEQFTLANLAIKRPGTGLPPSYFYKLIGRKAACDIAEDVLLQEDHFV